MKNGVATVAQLAEFDEIIDVRSPLEFAEDHIPGAINCPVLNDEQRAEVGTLYKQVSPFEAKKLGAAYISANIAAHLRERFLDRPKGWKPLIACWRGGMRSGAMVTVFRSIGWNAQQLEGGYKAYRHMVVADLETLPPRFAWKVVAGATGSGKSRVLHHLAAAGAQVLDLEALACHKGSVLGVLPGAPQPSQKWFETGLRQALQGFDPARPVYVEAESRKIGKVHVPEALITAIRGGACRVVSASVPARVDFLLRDYDYFLADPEWLVQRLGGLKALRGGETIARWSELARAGNFRALVEELLTGHYDPLYAASQDRNYTGLATSREFATDDLSEAGIAALAASILAADTQDAADATVTA